MQMPLSEKYMNRSEHQQLVDEILGEATLVLLQRAGPVSFRALIEQLQVMEDQSDDADRRQLIAQTIVEVRKNIAEGERAKQQRAEGLNSVQHLYTDSHHSGNNRKH
ncbi:hypothetical protein PUG46_18825 [Erwiniaceae bacterium L1_55_4]|nr:hypothetical protein [Erwiniaceae bacterium L1_55_4]